MDHSTNDDATEELRESAIRLASRIRIALPYRPASLGDLAAIDAALGPLRTAGLPEDDDAVEELRNLRETLEILTIGSEF